MQRLLALAFVLALAAPAAAQERRALEWEGRLTLGPGWDTNVQRRSAGPGVVADGTLFLLGGADLRWRQGEGHLTTLSWDGGSRVFAENGGEDQLAHLLAASHALQLGEAWVAGAELRRRDQLLRDGERDAAETAGNLFVAWDAHQLFAPRLRAGWRRFDWWPDERWSGEGPWAGITVQARPWRRHVASAGYEAHLRDHPERRETLHQGHLGWSWRGPILLSGGYLLGHATSDRPGYASVRHRFQALLGARLPAGLLLNAQAVLQLVRFPEGFRLDQFTVADDEESLSSLSLKLARPIGAGLSVEARYQLHLATFVRADLSYERHLLGTAVTWRF